MPDSGKDIGSVLLIRNDRIGDLVLTTPAFRVLREALPEARIDLLCSAYAEPVVWGNPCLDNVIPGRGAHDRGDVRELTEEIKARNYDAAVVFVSSRKNAMLVRQAQIPLRVGPWVRLFDPLFYNQAVRQHRSKGERHEAAHNVDLLSRLDIELPLSYPLPEVTADFLARDVAAGILNERFGETERKLVVVHPGMGGSALNWPESCWTELIGKLAGQSGVNLALTGSSDEMELVERLAGPSAAKDNVQMIIGLGLKEFIALLSLADAVVAPSTGPLHLAAALGVKKVAGIYSPVPAHHPKRWGPLGSGEIKAFLPGADCPALLKCQGEKCPEYDCMERIKPADVTQWMICEL